jgi:hypothetical protein
VIVNQSSRRTHVVTEGLVGTVPITGQQHRSRELLDASATRVDINSRR